MKKQTALLLSTLVLMSAVSMQPAHAFKFNKLKFWEKKAKPAVTAPVKATVKAPEVVVKKEVPVAVKAAPAAAVKPVVAPAKPAVVPAKPAVKAPVKK